MVPDTSSPFSQGLCFESAQPCVLTCFGTQQETGSYVREPSSSLWAWPVMRDRKSLEAKMIGIIWKTWICDNKAVLGLLDALYEIEVFADPTRQLNSPQHASRTAAGSFLPRHRNLLRSCLPSSPSIFSPLRYRSEQCFPRGRSITSFF